MSDVGTPRDGAARWALMVWLVAWMANGGVYLSLFVNAGASVVIEADGLLGAAWISMAAFTLPVGLAVFAIARGGRRATGAAATAGAVCALVLLVHISTFDDAGFVTAFWAALWIGWVSASPDAEVHRWGARLAQAVVSLVFLGATLGKLTPEYLGGDVFHNLYFLHSRAPLYVGLREAVAPDTLRMLATGFSVGVVVVEGALATGVLWPTRIALAAGAAAAVGIVATSVPAVFAATGPVLAVCVGGWMLGRGADYGAPAPIGWPSYAPSPKSA